MLGLVGGIATLLWGSLTILTSFYQSFRYETKLISQIYPTAPSDPNEELPDDESKAEQKVVVNVAERGRYYYSIL